MRKIKYSMSISILVFLILIVFLFAGCSFLKGVIPGTDNTEEELINLPDSGGIAEYVEQEVLVKIKPGADIDKIVSEVGGTIIETLPQISVIRIKLASGVTVAEAIKTLKGFKEVEYAEPNGICYMHLVPNDTDYGSQWAPQLTEAESAWDETTGASGVIIAVTDTGVDGTHPDFGGKVIAGRDTFNNIPISANTDSSVHYHGTHCAGIAAAVGNNSQGMAGVAWGSKIMPIKICKDVPNYSASWSDMADAFMWAADSRADIISCSFGGKGYSQTMKDAIDYAVIDNGCVMVASMGNSSRNETSYPAGYQSVIAVGATNAHDEIADFSTTGDHISVCAPGVEIYSTMPGGGYDYLSGTSMSCPFVAGAAALILSQNPGMSPEEVKTQLEETAVDLGSLGFDSVFGYGRLDLAAVVGTVGENKYGVVDVLVTDESSNPLSGASVILWQGGAVISTTNSNEDGHAKFEYILSGEYGISVSFPGFNSSLAAENLVTVFAGESVSTTIAIEAKVSKWTIMVYMDGDNTLDSCAWDDLMELESVSSTDEIKIVAQLDAYYSCSGTFRYYISNAAQGASYPLYPDDIVQTLPEQNMADPATLTSFVNWATINYPAEKYLLVIWNHGGGWRDYNVLTKGVIWDDTSGDYLTMAELVQGLEGINEGIDIIGFDACLMQMAEVAYEISGLTNVPNYMVGSEESEWGDGWPYDDILTHLLANPEMTDVVLSETIVDDFINYCGSVGTLSTLDFSAGTYDTYQTLNSFATALMASSYQDEIAAARSSAQSYSYNDGYRCKDIFDFAEKIYNNVSDCQSEALAVINQVNNLVLCEAHLGSGVENSHGLSIYLPDDAGEYNTDYDGLQFAIDTQWDEFLQYIPNIVPPTVTTLPADNITTTSAQLHGSIDATGGEEPSGAGFEYRLKSGGLETTVKYGVGNYYANLTGLTPGTTYEFRFWAENSAGKTYGDYLEFSTSS